MAIVPLKSQPLIPLESLPLGFRFRPTDEELVNHYLKRKITGDIQSEREVIPEIDVCKCEPWDLPDKALIRSDDPEWFFFAPKDRKYPNGSRSNRATEKGYWKATGKDRIIRSKGPTRQAITVGMKKTLVFHKGRAPRGQRTHWIMHEYRTTEPEYESGEQGGYVLYKLFRKPDERAPGQPEEAEPTTADVVEGSGFSPAPSRSSPGGTQQDVDSSEEITAPVDHKSVLQHDRLNLPNSDAGKKVGIQRFLDDRADCKPEKQADINSNYAINQPQNMYTGPPPDVLLDQFSNLENHHIVRHSGNDDDANYIINSFFAEDPDVHSPGESTQQERVNQGGVNQDETVWSDGMINIDDLLMDVPDDCLDISALDAISPSLYENAAPLPYDSTDQDVYSVDSGADSLQDLFNTLEESSTQRNNLMASNDASGLDGTGIIIRPRQPDALIAHNVAPRRLHFGNQQNTNLISSNQFDQMSTNSDAFEGTGITIRPRNENFHQLQADVHPINHGMARRRLCLQTRLDIGTMSCAPGGIVKSDETELDEHGDQNSAESEAASSVASSVDDKLTELSVNDDNDASQNKSRVRPCKNTTNPIESESVGIKSVSSPKRVLRNSPISFQFWCIMAILVLCIGMLPLYSSIVKGKM